MRLVTYTFRGTTRLGAIEIPRRQYLRRLRQWGHSQGILTGLRQRTSATWTRWTTW